MENLKRSDRNFEIGDYVFPKLQPYKHHSMARRQLHKLYPNLFSPYQIHDKIGKVAYQLNLPAEGAYDIFLVSQLKKCANLNSSLFVPLS